MRGYEAQIREIVPDVEPDLVEAWMRLQHGTLDGLDAATFALDAMEAAELVRNDRAGSIELAATYGFEVKP